MLGYSWFEIATVAVIGIVFVWAAVGEHGGAAVVDVLCAPLDCLLAPAKLVHRIANDEARPAWVRGVAGAVMKLGAAVLLAIGTGVVLALEFHPRLAPVASPWH
jgi:hypothetical protein